MAYLRCDFASEALKMNTSMIVLLPDNLKLSEVPVVYLLHGLSDNCTGWTRFSAVERYAREHGAAVVMPEVQRSFYTDMVYGMDYFTYIQEELPRVCRRFFGLSPEREKNYIMGLSMGGYGALKCAFLSPSRYAGCAGFSSVADIGGWQSRTDEKGKKEFCALFGGKNKLPVSSNLFCLTETADADTLPEIYLTCGEQDMLYPENVRLAELLKERGVKYQFLHWPGDHNWEFWDLSVKQAFDVLLPALEA